MPHSEPKDEGTLIVLHTNEWDQTAAEELSDFIQRYAPEYRIGQAMIGPIQGADNAKRVLDEINARSNHLEARANRFKLPQPIHEWRADRDI